MKECIYCAKEIQDDAMTCPWCETWLGPIPDVDKMKAENDVDGLIDALAISGMRQVSEDAAYALGGIGDERAVDPLIQFLKKDAMDGAAACNGLIGIGKPAVKPLIELLKDQDTDVRNFAEIALEKISEPEAEKALVEYRAG